MTAPLPVAKQVPHLDRLNQGATLHRLGAQILQRPGELADPYQWRMGVVVSPLIDAHHYNVQVSGDGITRTMQSLAEFAPAIGDSVWVAQFGPSFLLMSKLDPPAKQKDRVTVIFTAVASVSGTISFPIPFPTGTVPTMELTVEVGANLDILPNVTAPPTATGFSWRLVQKAGGIVSGTAQLHWVAYG